MFETLFGMVSVIAPCAIGIYAAIMLGLGIGIAIGAILWPETVNEFSIEIMDDFR